MERRSELGIVGYCRAGAPAGRYIFVLRVDVDEADPRERRWHFEFSHPVGDDLGIEQFIPYEGLWSTLWNTFEEWDVEWSPPQINDRALFLLFELDVTSKKSGYTERKKIALEPITPLRPTVAGSGILRTTTLPSVFGELVLNALNSLETVEDDEGLDRFGRRELKRLREGTDSMINAVLTGLWDAGFGLAVVPLRGTASIAERADPWADFR